MDVGTQLQSEDRIREIKAWLDDPSTADLNAMLSRAHRVQLLLSSEIGARLAEPLNRRLKEMPHHRYQDKTVLCRWLNAQLGGVLHLGVQCPRTSVAGLLICDKGENPDVGRFQIRVSRSDAERPVTFTSAHLPTLGFGPRVNAHPDMRRHPRSK